MSEKEENAGASKLRVDEEMECEVNDDEDDELMFSMGLVEVVEEGVKGLEAGKKDDDVAIPCVNEGGDRDVL